MKLLKKIDKWLRINWDGSTEYLDMYVLSKALPFFCIVTAAIILTAPASLPIIAIWFLITMFKQIKNTKLDD